MTGDLAPRLEKMIGRIHAVIENNSTMSVEGQAIALGMILTVHVGLLEEVLDELRRLQRG